MRDAVCEVKGDANPSGSLWRWLQEAEPPPQLLSPWPIPRAANWVAKVNEPLTGPELAGVRLSALRGRPIGESNWVEKVAQRNGLASTLRPRGRPQVRFPEETREKEQCPLRFWSPSQAQHARPEKSSKDKLGYCVLLTEEPGCTIGPKRTKA